MSQANVQTDSMLTATNRSVGRSTHTADVLDRLARLRTVLPAMGMELATARREVAQLRLENRKLKDRLHCLEASLDGATVGGSLNGG
jgi:hypothetical protein